jgi:hypothetical protein
MQGLKSVAIQTLNEGNSGVDDSRNDLKNGGHEPRRQLLSKTT